jgi:hypothetical protein
MRAAIRGQARRAIAAAAMLTGKRFGLLVASSVVATSAIVASAMTVSGDSGALAALIGRSLASRSAPAASVSSPSPSTIGTSGSPAAEGGSPAPAPEPAPLAAPGPAPAPQPAGEPAAKPDLPAAAETTPEAGQVKHVFVISLTSPGYEQSLGAQSQMPYLSATLRPQGELLSNYTLLEAGALPNGIAAIGGQPPNAATSAGCPAYEEFTSAKAQGDGVIEGAGCVYPVETLTLADQLTLAHFTWRAYVDGMVDATGKSADCVHPDPGEPSTSAEPGGYAASQNPFAYFHSLLDLGDCSADDLPIGQLTKDLGRKADAAPSYSFIAPTPCDSGATGQCAPGATEGAAGADAFLSAWAPKILASPAYKAGGLLIVTFSAANPANQEAPPPSGDALRTGALLLSPFVTAGGTDDAAYDPYSLLRSSEDLFGLGPLGLAGAGKTKSFATGILAVNDGD